MARPSAERVLVTGGTGGLGQALLPLLVARGFEVSALYRSSHPDMPEVEWLQGDVTLPNLGLERKRWHFTRLYHLAAIVELGPDKRREIWNTNVTGTLQVIFFCQRNKIRRVHFVSTAYVDKWEAGLKARNPYEESKGWAEAYVSEAAGDLGEPMRKWHPPLRAVILRPSILLPEPGPNVPAQGVLQVAAVLVRLHRRVEIIRRKVEGTLRLPILEPLFRLRGDGGGTLNLVRTSWVAEKIAQIETPGVYWLTNPQPPKLSEVLDWVGESVMLKLRFEDSFPATPLEALFHRLTASFSPYLRDTPNLPSSFNDCPGISREYIQNLIEISLLRKPD